MFQKRHLSPKAILTQVLKFGLVLVNVMQGVGKTYLAQSLLIYQDLQVHYGKVVFLTETHANLAEIKTFLDKCSISYFVLQPRPKELCGVLDDAWSRLETRGNSTYAKSHLCKRCDNLTSCKWRYQLKSAEAKAAFIILAVIDNLFQSKFIKIIAGRLKTLIIIDESKLITRDLLCRIKKQDLQLFSLVLNDVVRNLNLDESFKRVVERYIQAAQLCNSEVNMRRMERLPYVFSSLALIIQEAGLKRSKHFRNEAYSLYNLSYQHPDLQYVDLDGDVIYKVQYDFEDNDVLLLCARMDLELASLNTNYILAPGHPTFEEIHEGTRIYNILDSSGSKYNFSKKDTQDRLLWVFAYYICVVLGRGSRVLLVSKKCFLQTVVDLLPGLVKEISGRSIQVISDYLTVEHDLEDLNKIPIISYGLFGVNLFQDYEVVLCLNSYYLHDQILFEKIRETDFNARKVKFSLTIVKGKRVIYPKLYSKDQALRRIANKVLYQHETAVVEQTVARVRFFTKPRTVVLFNKSHYKFPITQEFKGMRAFKKFFSIPDRKKFLTMALAARVLSISNNTTIVLAVTAGLIAAMEHCTSCYDSEFIKLYISIIYTVFNLKGSYYV